VHEVEAAVDLVERDRVGDERVDVDVSGEVAVDVGGVGTPVSRATNSESGSAKRARRWGYYRPAGKL